MKLVYKYIGACGNNLCIWQTLITLTVTVREENWKLGWGLKEAKKEKEEFQSILLRRIDGTCPECGKPLTVFLVP